MQMKYCVHRNAEPGALSGRDGTGSFVFRGECIVYHGNSLTKFTFLIFAEIISITEAFDRLRR
jgi:hypothetical protein